MGRKSKQPPQGNRWFDKVIEACIGPDVQSLLVVGVVIGGAALYFHFNPSPPPSPSLPSKSLSWEEKRLAAEEKRFLEGKPPLNELNRDDLERLSDGYYREYYRKP